MMGDLNNVGKGFITYEFDELKEREVNKNKKIKGGSSEKLVDSTIQEDE